MLLRLKAAGLIWPTIISILALPVLIALGAWQWHRMEWKEDLIAKIEARAQGEPESYAQVLDQFARDGEAEYQKVRVRGTFDHTTERYLYAPNQQSQGWNVFTLLMPENGGRPLFVNRGWVPDRLKDPATRVEGQVTGLVEVVGLVRGPEKPGMFDVASDLKRKQWYWRDLEGMRWAPDPPPAPQQREAMRIAAYAPFSIDALAEPVNPGGWPKGGTTEVHLSNRHLEYVLTWWGLAATLVIVYIAFAGQRLRGDQKETLRQRSQL